MTATVKTVRRRIRRSATQWRELFDRFEQSDQSREQFCREQGVSLSSFDRWGTRLRTVPSTPSAISEEPVFVELKPTSIQQPATPAWDIELQLGADIFLRLRRSC